MKKQQSRHYLHPISILSFVLNEERRSSLLILASAVLAIALANSKLSVEYFDLLSHKLTLLGVSMDIKHWINEALMAVFFLVVGLEVKRELLKGELRTWRKASFPVYAALGGMIVPALLFALINPSLPESKGWGIPMATDIAIALGVLALLGSSIPRTLRIFLLSLAIIDDIGSIIIIGIFYNQPTNMFALLCAIILSLSLLIVRRNNFWPFWFVLISLGILFCLLYAGVSGTLAGVAVAFSVPIVSNYRKKKTFNVAEFIERKLVPVTSFFIVPLFVFANAGLSFSGISFSNPEGNTVFFGILVGLLFGKPLGIVASTWLADRLRLADKPRSISWSHITGIGCIAGIGFTISLLITDLAYKDSNQFYDYSKLAIFLASFASATIGLTILRHANRSH